MNEIQAKLALLSGREAEVIMLRCGLLGRCAHTLEEVGKKFGVTRERIRQIEAKARKKIGRQWWAEPISPWRINAVRNALARHGSLVVRGHRRIGPIGQYYMVCDDCGHSRWSTAGRMSKPCGRCQRPTELDEKAGDRIGEWTLISRAYVQRSERNKQSGGRMMWLARCSCGREKHVDRQALHRGDTRGCLDCYLDRNRM